MARSRLCRVCGGFHDLEAPWPHNCVGHFGAVASAAPHVISDTMDAMVSMADGRTYDSKSRYRAELKARGCVEVGNERIERKITPLPPVRDDLRRAYNQLQR